MPARKVVVVAQLRRPGGEDQGGPGGRCYVAHPVAGRGPVVVHARPASSRRPSPSEYGRSGTIFKLLQTQQSIQGPGLTTPGAAAMRCAGEEAIQQAGGTSWRPWESPLLEWETQAMRRLFPGGSGTSPGQSQRRSANLPRPRCREWCLGAGTSRSRGGPRFGQASSSEG